MRKNERGSSIVKSIIVTIISIVIFYFLYHFLMQYYFGEYIKAVHINGVTEFKRDKEVRYSEIDSFKIISNNYNDAMLCKEFTVTPNTPYKVTCMVKTENVINENDVYGTGAQVCIADTTEMSESITGTTDEWKKIELRFHSKNRDKVVIGFRLGGYADNCKGTAWFSDFKLQRGALIEDTNWNFACFIFKNIDVNINGTNIKVSMNNKDTTVIKENMIRFKNSCAELSRNMMQVNYDLFEVEAPITSLSNDTENGYYVSAKDVDSLIRQYIDKEAYDHIFVAFRFGDSDTGIDIPVKGWMGLGSMEYMGIGFSNIKLPTDRSNVIYEYYVNQNTFPEEVFVHEFLHSLERDLLEYGYHFPALHDNEKYGYQSDNVVGLKKWYGDYMTCSVNNPNGDGKTGLNSLAYKLKPIHEDSFCYTIDIEMGWKKDNLFDVIRNSIKLINTQINLNKENISIESFRI